MRCEARARAKVNLCLSVLGKRPDGYHEVETIMQSVNLYDTLSFEIADATSVTIAWDRGLMGDLPREPDLVRRAVDLFNQRAGRAVAVKAGVIKRIPIGSGLGGGSADAAATLVAMNQLAGNLLTTDELAGLAAELGADVPFCLRGGTVLASGRGEVLDPLNVPRPMWWVLGLPYISLGTKSVYDRYEEIWVPERPPCRDLAESLAKGAVAEVATMLGNDLEEPAFQLAHDLERLMHAMQAAGALATTMSGSGSAVAGLCLNESHAREVAISALLSFPRVEVVPSTSLGAEIIS